MFDDLSMSQIQELLADTNLQEDLQTQLSLLQIATPPVPAPLGTVAVADSMGILHITPGMMGTISFPQPYPHIDMVIDGGGEFTSFTSDNDAVVSNMRLNNYLESSSASAAVLSQGQTTLTIDWTDGQGTPQTTSLIVVAS